MLAAVRGPVIVEATWLTVVKQFKSGMRNISYFGGQIIILSPSQGPDQIIK
jgi:hypothetical protein